MDKLFKIKKMCLRIRSFLLKNIKSTILLLAAAVFLLGTLFGFLIFLLVNSNRDNGPRQIRQGGFRFINPLLECELGDNISQNYIPFEREIKAKILEEMGNVDSTSFAVYFRNLNNGPWFGINEKEKFMPASLLKVPLMIAYFKEAETDPGVLREEIVVREGNDGILSQEIKPKIILEHGKPYTVDELIERMIIYSDNKAADILFNNVSPKKLDEIYANLGIDIPIGGNINQDYMSVKSYASFFRILFNSSYLSREMSEKALSLLAKSDYKKALAAGVPSGVAIAHKFGEYKDLNRQNGYMELHDCGIIYSPDYPYLLCIMTSGRSIGENEKVITKISSIVYDEIASH